MPEQKIEDFILEVLTGDTQKFALEFVAYLRTNEMLFERCCNGYWEDKLYWFVKYQNQYVCFILLDGYEKGHWVIWSDDSDSNCFEDFPLDEHIRKVAWENVDFCINCGNNCSSGENKTIFGKQFSNVCRTTMRFDNPDADELDCLKKVVSIRKISIDNPRLL